MQNGDGLDYTLIEQETTQNDETSVYLQRIIQFVAHCRFFNNPIIHKDVVERLKGHGLSLILLLTLLFISGAFLLGWAIFIHQADPDSAHRRLCAGYLFAATGLALLTFIPAFGSLSIVNERQRRTWEHLLFTPLNYASILWGKVISLAVIGAVLLFSTIPVYGLCVSMRCITVGETAFLYLLLLEQIVILSLIGLYCSIRCKSELNAVLSAYSLIVLYTFAFILPPKAWFLQQFVFPFRDIYYYLLEGKTIYSITKAPFAVYLIARFEFVFAVIALLVFLCLWNLYKREALIASPSLLQDLNQAVGRNIETYIPLVSFKRQRQGFLSDRTNPIVWKELRMVYHRSGVWLLVWVLSLVFFGVVVLMLNTYFKMNGHSIERGFNWEALLKLWPMTLIPYLTLPYAAFCFSRETDQDMEEQLKATGISSQRIIQGKFRAGLFLFSVQFWAFYTLIFTTGLFHSLPLTSECRSVLYRILVAVPLCYSVAGVSLSIGAVCSAITGRFRMAFTIGLAAVLVWLFGGEYLLNLSDRDAYPYAWQAVMLISPFTLFNHFGFNGITNGTWLTYITIHCIGSVILCSLLYWFLVKKIGSANED